MNPPIPSEGSSEGAARLAELAAKARLLERLLVGDDRQLLARELREGLDAVDGPRAEIVPLDVKRRAR